MIWLAYSFFIILLDVLINNFFGKRLLSIVAWFHWSNAVSQTILLIHHVLPSTLHYKLSSFAQFLLLLLRLTFPVLNLIHQQCVLHAQCFVSRGGSLSWRNRDERNVVFIQIKSSTFAAVSQTHTIVMFPPLKIVDDDGLTFLLCLLCFLWLLGDDAGVCFRLNHSNGIFKLINFYFLCKFH